MNIPLRFINQSEAASPLNLVIFQKNAVHLNAGTAVAWRVFSQFSQGDVIPLSYDFYTTIAAGSFGALSPQQPSPDGSNFTYEAKVSGTQLIAGTPTANSPVISVTNNLPVGAIDVNVYRGGYLVGLQTGIAPEQMAQFVFEPVLFLGLFDGVQQGSLMALTPLSASTTMINLMGLSSTDVVLSGGGQTPLFFTLQNERPM